MPYTTDTTPPLQQRTRTATPAHPSRTMPPGPPARTPAARWAEQTLAALMDQHRTLEPPTADDGPETFAAAVAAELAALETAEQARGIIEAAQLDALARMH